MIVAYVLGSSIDNFVEESKIGTSTFIYPMTYNLLLQKAHARTFNLMNKIKEAKEIENEDEEMAVMQQKSLFDTFSDT